MVKALVFFGFKSGGALDNKCLYADLGTIFYMGGGLSKVTCALLK